MMMTLDQSRAALDSVYAALDNAMQEAAGLRIQLEAAQQRIVKVSADAAQQIDALTKEADRLRALLNEGKPEALDTTEPVRILTPTVQGGIDRLLLQAWIDTGKTGRVKGIGVPWRKIDGEPVPKSVQVLGSTIQGARNDAGFGGTAIIQLVAQRLNAQGRWETVGQTDRVVRMTKTPAPQKPEPPPVPTIPAKPKPAEAVVASYDELRKAVDAKEAKIAVKPGLHDWGQSSLTLEGVALRGLDAPTFCTTRNNDAVLKLGTGCSLRDLAFDGTRGTSKDGTAIQLIGGSSDIALRNLSFFGTADKAIGGHNITRLLMLDCEFANCGRVRNHQFYMTGYVRESLFGRLRFRESDNAELDFKIRSATEPGTDLTGLFLFDIVSENATGNYGASIYLDHIRDRRDLSKITMLRMQTPKGRHAEVCDADGVVVDDSVRATHNVSNVRTVTAPEADQLIAAALKTWGVE